MGLWPTRENENQRCRPRESGDPPSVQWIPAFSGMTCTGVILRRAAGDEESRSGPENIQSEIPLPRCARGQNDSLNEVVPHTLVALTFKSALSRCGARLADLLSSPGARFRLADSPSMSQHVVLFARFGLRLLQILA